jgi:anti-sigma regulatory factor (Ser/Thr protein kinase)
MAERGERHEHASTTRLPFAPEAARTARRIVDELLVTVSASAEVREDAALVVHELVMNGLVHGRADEAGELRLDYGVVSGHLVLTVVDHGASGTVAVREAGTEAPSGRGLAIVAALCADWSVDRSAGTAVSARLRL